MEDYEILEHIGGGSFTDIFKENEKSIEEFVAFWILKKYKK